MGMLNISEKDGRLVARAVIKALSGRAEPMSKEDIHYRRMQGAWVAFDETSEFTREMYDFIQGRMTPDVLMSKEDTMRRRHEGEDMHLVETGQLLRATINHHLRVGNL